MDSPNKLQKYKSTKSTKKYKKYISTKVLITQSFLELQTPDFAWKFICTVQPNEKVQKYKSTKVQKYRKIKKCKKHKTYKKMNLKFGRRTSHLSGKMIIGNELFLYVGHRLLIPLYLLFV